MLVLLAVVAVIVKLRYSADADMADIREYDVEDIPADIQHADCTPDVEAVHGVHWHAHMLGNLAVECRTDVQAVEVDMHRMEDTHGAVEADTTYLEAVDTALAAVDVLPAEGVLVGCWRFVAVVVVGLVEMEQSAQLYLDSAMIVRFLKGCCTVSAVQWVQSVCWMRAI